MSGSYLVRLVLSATLFFKNEDERSSQNQPATDVKFVLTQGEYEQPSLNQFTQQILHIL